MGFCKIPNVSRGGWVEVELTRHLLLSLEQNKGIFIRKKKCDFFLFLIVTEVLI